MSDTPEREDDARTDPPSEPMPEPEDTAPARSGKGSADILAAQADFPRVQEHAIQAEAGQDEPEAAGPAAPTTDGPTDYKGRPFDPAIHVSDSLGNPVLGDRNKLKIKPSAKGGRPPKVQSIVGAAKPSKADPVQAPGPAAPEVDEAKLKASAAVLTGGFFTIAQILGGPDFKPEYIDEAQTINERALLESSVADYLRATGATDIPPGIALAIVAGSIVASRATRPTVQARFAKMVGHFRKSKSQEKAVDVPHAVVDENGNPVDVR